MIAASLSFKNTHFQITDINGQPWLRGLQIASALGYKNPSSDITNLYDRNADEFTDSMTRVIELTTAGGKQQVRVFSLRGCHLLGMLARTKVAKEFRRWVLDVLEETLLNGKVSDGPAAKTTADDRTPLRQAVAALVGRKGIDYSTAYGMVHQRFNVGAIEDIPAEKLPEAIAYVHALTLHTGLVGEVLDAEPAPAPFDDLDVAHLLLHAQDIRLFIRRYLPAFENLGIDKGGALWSYVHDTAPVFNRVRAAALPRLKDQWLQQRIMKTAGV